MQLLTPLAGVAMATAALGHGTAGSGEAMALRLEREALRASAVHLGSSARQRRGWEGHSGGCPRGATTPARTAMAAVGRSYDFSLTTAQSDQRWGGEGRGDHGEATDGLGNPFSWWRARTMAAMHGQQWQTATVAWRCAAGGEEMRTGAGECVGQARGGFKTRLAVPGRPRRVACTLRRAATSGATRPTDSEVVGHD